jgi:hypothetical protein
MFETFSKNTCFTKPPQICVDLSEEEESWLKQDASAFARACKKHLEKKIQGHNYNLRYAGVQDVYDAYHFGSQQYGQELADAISTYDIFRFISFGHGLIIEDENKKIRGCLYEAAYNTKEKTSLSIRLGIDKSLAGKDLGSILTRYSCVLSMEEGSAVKRALIEMGNENQLYIQLNKVGWIIDGFFDDIRGLVPTLTVMLPLNPSALLRNRIDMKKCTDYLKTLREGVDYVLTDTNDPAKIKYLYRETNYRISAYLKPGTLDKKAKLLALPADMLGLK